jgi:hypothetical protein
MREVSYYLHGRLLQFCVGFEVFTTMVRKSFIYRDITQSNDSQRKFPRNMLLRLLPALCRFSMGLLFNPEDGGKSTSGMTFEFQRTTWHDILKHRTLLQFLR